MHTPSTTPPQPHVARNQATPAELAAMTPAQLRQRRRRGFDTARHQRRALKDHRRVAKGARVVTVEAELHRTKGQAQ